RIGIGRLVLSKESRCGGKEEQAREQAEESQAWNHASHAPFAFHGFPHPLVSARGPRGYVIIASVTGKARVSVLGGKGGVAQIPGLGKKRICGATSVVGDN